MPSVDVARKTTTGFEFAQMFLFKLRFNKDELFRHFQGYYNPDRYWSESPEGDLSEVKQILNSFFSELMIADRPLDYCVIQDKKRELSKIPKNSVATNRQGNCEIFLIEDKLSARQEVEKGATPIQKSGLSVDQIQRKTDGS